MKEKKEICCKKADKGEFMYSQFNEMVVNFHNQMLFLRLVNSGSVHTNAVRNEYTQKAFNMAYNILRCAYNNKRIDIFNKIYSETHELVKGPYATPEMEKIQNDFYINTQNWVRGIAEYMAYNGKIR